MKRRHALSYVAARFRFNSSGATVASSVAMSSGRPYAAAKTRFLEAYTVSCARLT